MGYRLWYGREKGLQNPDIYATRASKVALVPQVLPIMSPKPALVLIPGAWHTGECYDLIIPPLKSAGYHVTALTLPSVGAEPPLESFDEDVALIHGTVERLADAGKDGIVVMHSYGGLPGSEAMEGLSREDRKQKGLDGGVVGLVYLCAWMVPEGESVFSSGGGRGGKGGPGKVKVDVCNPPPHSGTPKYNEDECLLNITYDD